MRVFDFTHAIMRAPGQSVVNGMRSGTHGPDFAGFSREHRAYATALRAAGLAVEMLPPLEKFPDSVFVEDPALVFAEGAILLNSGSPARRDERGAMRGVLQSRFDAVLELEEGEFADGGDVLVMPGTIFIGVSARTNLAGARALERKLAVLGRKARIVETPKTVLHLKTAASPLGEETILAARSVAESGILSPFKIIPVPDGEEGAANVLRVNDFVLAGDCYPRTVALLEREKYRVARLAVTHIARLDAGLSCLSLRWPAFHCAGRPARL